TSPSPITPTAVSTWWFITSAYEQRDWSNTAGGIMRVDVRDDESGCDVLWHSSERSPSVVAKLSAGTGLGYFY
ncbi:MAG: hypothetical protein WAU27_12975, partial [Pseudomonadales bacterium]